MRWWISIFVALALVALGLWLFQGSHPTLPLPAPAAEAPARAEVPPPAKVEAQAESPAARAPASSETAAQPKPAVAPGAFELRVRGRCVDTQEHPVAGAQIDCWIYYVADEPGALADSREYATFDEGAHPLATSDAQGGFEFAFAPGKGADAKAFSVRMWIGAQGRVRADVSADFARGATGDCGTVVLPRGATLRGLVVDANGAAVEGVRVRAYPRDEGGNRAHARGPAYSIAPVKSAANGQFELLGAPPGVLELSARAEDARESKNLRLELAEAETREDLRLVLPALDDSNSISGVVLSPKGEPLPYARIRANWKYAGGTTGHGVSANGSGVFRIELPGKTTVRMGFEDREQRYGGVSLESVESGTHGLRVVLVEPRFLELRAEDASGPLEHFGWIVRVQRGEHSFELAQPVADAPRAGGRAQLFAGSDPFFVELRADGYSALELGPFRADALPAEALFRLERSAGIRGRVEAGGKALAGARVVLWKALAAGHEATVDNLPAEMLPFGDEVSALSAADGSFLLPVSAPGRLHVRASAPGFASAVSAVLDYAPAQGVGDLVLALTPGGAIEGRAFAPDGSALAGAWVAATDGWPPAACVQTDAQGAFRFEHLRPGRYRVCTIPRAITQQSQGWSEGSPQDGPAARKPGDCVVAEGATTHYDLRPEAGAEIVLHLSAGLRALGEWNAYATVGSDGISREGSASWNATRDEVRFALPGSGTCALGIELPGENPGRPRCMLSRRFEIGPGTSTQSLDIALGTVKGRLKAGGDAAAMVLLSAKLEQDWELYTFANVDGQRAFTIPCAPAGTCRISRNGGNEVREIAVKAGETLELEDL